MADRFWIKHLEEIAQELARCEAAAFGRVSARCALEPVGLRLDLRQVVDTGELRLMRFVTWREFLSSIIEPAHLVRLHLDAMLGELDAARAGPDPASVA